MTKFTRSFDSANLASQLDAAPILRSLLDQWQLPGPDSSRTRHGLRLAVRAGYLNFYAKGQSVAKLSLPGGFARLDVHHKYLSLPKTGGDYLTFKGEALKALPGDVLDGWVEEALQYSGAEKRFVDDLVTANPGTIDLEMGLPGDVRVRKSFKNGDGQEVLKKVAPRMDLVLLQPAGDHVQLAFWEAKCGDNGELRAQGDAPPHVQGQLAKYVEWLRLTDRGQEVLRAYISNAGILLELARLVGKSPCRAMDLWRQATAPLTMVASPGVVIGYYGAPSLNPDELDARNALLKHYHRSFEALHKGKLRGVQPGGHPIQVEEYCVAPAAPLPVLNGLLIGQDMHA